MSQTAPAPAPQAAPPPPAAAKAPAPAAAQVDTPALLNRWQLIGMSVAIVFGVLSALIQFGGWQSDGRAADDTEQLVRIQKIQSSLLSADALATNAFLVGGLENTEQRNKYDAAIDQVLTGIAEAAQAQPADEKALVALNEQVEEYASFIAQARANNRQGFPVGAAYQSLASDQLRNETIPVLNALVEANNQRAEDAMGGQHPFWLLVLGVVALVALVWLNRELAKHFRRRINKGVAVAGVIVLAVTLVSVVGSWIRDSSNDSLRDGEFEDAVSSATARTAANDAKANESLRLIRRGSGAANEEAWAKAAARVEEDAPERLLGDWRAYTASHTEIVRLDDSNNWDKAVTKATAAGTEKDPTAFDKFDTDLSSHVDEVSAGAIEDLDSGRTLALVLSALTLLLGVAAAVSVARGIGERRREFS